MEGREIGQIEPVVEDQGGLDPSVGEKQAARQLWKVVEIFGHDGHSDRVVEGVGAACESPRTTAPPLNYPRSVRQS